MNFASEAFIGFVVVVFIVYWFLQRKAQNVFILLASYFFYAQWDWRFLGLIMFSTAFFTCQIYCDFSGHHERETTIVELKHDPANDRDADRIAGVFPFRVTKSSKYVTGMSPLNQGLTA